MRLPLVKRCGMTVEVALAMLHRQGRWLMQLRDDIPGIVAPGCWGLFGGHLDPGETAEQALRRELEEEISWRPQSMSFWMDHRNQRRLAHVFRVELTVPIAELRLREGQDMALITPEQLCSGTIWSHRLGAHRPLADGLEEVVRQTLACG
jgi:8-oxo-dGTP pyrophosphatase MutT (NUDIX family)